MKKNKFDTWIGAGFILLFVFNINLVLLGIIYSNTLCTVSGILLSLFQLWLHDCFARKASVLQNTPYVAWLRDIFSFLPAGFLDQFIPLQTSNCLNQQQNEVIASRIKGTDMELIANSLASPFDGGYECVLLSSNPVVIKERELFTEIGAGNCREPYLLNALNIGSFNHKTPNNSAVLAIARAAKLQHCAVNTGVLGITSELLRSGSDLIWRINHFDPVCRNADGTFNEAVFQKTAQRPYIRMIELQITPQHFPIAGNSISFHHTIFLLEKLKCLSGGKPIGISLNKPGSKILDCICKTMFFTGIFLDFITIEDSCVYNNHLNKWQDNAVVDYSVSLATARQAVDQYALPTQIIASADFVTEYDVLRAVALGAHACLSIRPFLAALDCKARLWSNNAESRRSAICNFHRNTIEATIKLMEACAYRTLGEVKAGDFYHRTSCLNLKTLDELHQRRDDFPGKVVLSNMN